MYYNLNGFTFLNVTTEKETWNRRKKAKGTPIWTEETPKGLKTFQSCITK